MLKLNVGSGQRKFGEGWTNVDCQDKWSPDVVADGAHMPMFEDGSAECMVLHHVLEHFGCGEGAGLLAECYRILARGGSLIITVPHVRELVKAWVTGRMDDQLFFTNLYGAYLGDEADRHKWGFTPVSLNDSLWAVAAWDDVVLFDWRVIPGADIVQAWWILGMEATK
jgi:SAM-dependent methyltransferase